MKSLKISLILISVLVILSIALLFVYNSNLFNNKEENLNNSIGELATIRPENDNLALSKKLVVLSFYDSKENCTLNGEIYLDNISLGKTENGNFPLNLNRTNFEDENKNTNYNYTLEIKGVTDECFKENKGLRFLRSWNIPEINSFGGELSLETELSPRKPSYYYEIQGFIRPNETIEYMTQIERYFEENNTEYNLDKINEYSTRYRSDSLLFNQEEYWQTPKETIEKGHGDCEDWAITSLSMIREYNNSLRCYNLLWEKHLSVFCYLDGNYIIYDQDKTKFKTNLIKTNSIEENKVKLREMRNNYFKYYGLNPNDRNIYIAFNEKELVEFKNQEDFIDWLVNFE